jgi:xanthine dehydrogenase accessory factor
MDIFEEIVRLRREGRRAALATIVRVNGSIPSFESSRMLVRDDGSIAGTVGGGCVEAEVWAAAKEVMQAEQPRSLNFNLNNDPSYDTGLICGGTLEIFVEPVLPAPQLVLFGGGHVSLALARMATQAGFETDVVDDRESFANRERFPMARDVYTTFEDAFEKIHPNSSTYLVIVTRGHKDDMRVLEWAIGTAPRYIGMIGSQRKVIAIYRALEAKGVPMEAFARVHAPVGIEIGAQTPEEIAVSILAELIAERRGSSAVRHKAVQIAAKSAAPAARG